MNKDLLIKTVAEATERTQKEIKEIIETTFGVIADTLVEGGEVKVAGFGKFYTAVRSARMGVNPQNAGEKIEIPESTVCRFKPSAVLKRAVKGEE